MWYNSVVVDTELHQKDLRRNDQDGQGLALALQLDSIFCRGGIMVIVPFPLGKMHCICCSSGFLKVSVNQRSEHPRQHRRDNVHDTPTGDAATPGGGVPWAADGTVIYKTSTL